MQHLPPPPSEKFAAVPYPIPPAPGAAVHEADPLKRRSRISWRSFGGDSFLVSVAVHVLLAALALCWVIRSVVSKPRGPENFVSPGGGGNRGETVRLSERPVAKKAPMTVTPVTRIVAKTSGAVSLPAAPATPQTSFGGELAGGAFTSKGVDGGFGGKRGLGSGPGGGERGLNGVFGYDPLKAPGLTGFFYDMKQDPAGHGTAYKDDVRAFVDEVLRKHLKTRSTAEWDARFFKAPNPLAVSQIFIPHRSANAAPEAFGVADRVSPSRWVALYRGVVTAPKTGRFRFWGLGDDALVVTLNNKTVLDAGWTMVTEKGSPNTGVGTVLGQTETKKGRPGAPFRAGPWISVDKGRAYPIEILLSEIPGGSFGAWLMMEEADPNRPGKGDGRLFLFRMSGEALPEGVVDDTGLGIDMSGKGLVWKARSSEKPAR